MTLFTNFPVNRHCSDLPHPVIPALVTSAKPSEIAVSFFNNSCSFPEEQNVGSTFFTKMPALLPGGCGLKARNCRSYTRADLRVTPNGTEAGFVLGKMGWSQEPSTALTTHFLLLPWSLFLFKLFGVIYFLLFPFSSTFS